MDIVGEIRRGVGLGNMRHINMELCHMSFSQPLDVVKERLDFLISNKVIDGQSIGEPLVIEGRVYVFVTLPKKERKK